MTISSVAALTSDSSPLNAALLLHNVPSEGGGDREGVVTTTF